MADPIYQCDNCRKTWAIDELNPVRDISMRVDEGGPTPDGECPDCGALCYEVKNNPKIVIYASEGLVRSVVGQNVPDNLEVVVVDYDDRDVFADPAVTCEVHERSLLGMTRVEFNAQPNTKYVW